MSNESFTLVSNQLKELGIKNHDFFLRTYDRSLINVDVYDENLPMTTKIRIQNECRINPWYYLREVARIPCQSGCSRPFELNRAGLAVIWCFLKSINFHMVTPIETNKTTSILSIMNWAFLFGVIDTDLLLFDNLLEDSALNLYRILDYQKMLPKFLLNTTNITHTKPRCIVNPFANNNIHIQNIPKSHSDVSINTIGRCLVEHIQLFDNMEFIPHIDKIIAASSPIFRTTQQKTLKTDGISCRMFISTVNNNKTPETDMINKMMSGSVKWDEYFYDLGSVHVKEYIKENFNNDIVYIEYPYYMLNKDEDWFDAKCAMLMHDQDKIDSELLLLRKKNIKGIEHGMNIFDDDFKIEFAHTIANNLCSMNIKDFNENQKIECSIETKFNKEELTTFIGLLQLLKTSSFCGVMPQKVIFTNGETLFKREEKLIELGYTVISYIEQEYRLNYYQKTLVKKIFYNKDNDSSFNIFGDKFKITINSRSNDGYYGFNFKDYADNRITPVNEIKFSLDMSELQIFIDKLSYIRSTLI